MYKVRIERRPSWVRLGSKSGRSECPYKRKGPSGRSHVKMEPGTGGTCPQAHGHLEPPEGKRQEDPPWILGRKRGPGTP